MIYLCIGGDIKKKNSYIKTLAKNQQIISLPFSFSKEMLFDYASNNSLFGEVPVVVVENILGDGEIILSPNELEILKKSGTTFVFSEDKLKVDIEKKYNKYTEKVEKFEQKAGLVRPKENNFAIVDAFARKNKIETWTLYIKAIESGVSPEAILGMFFWKIKTMILTNSKIFTKDELRNFSKELVGLYHKAHRGECDMTIGLEQFILNSLK